jgi:hypothetical protein
MTRSINVVRIMIVSEFEAYLTDDSRSIIYDHYRNDISIKSSNVKPKHQRRL